MQPHSTLPLAVDLDGTLISTDALVEAVFAMIKSNPLTLVQLPFWLLSGKAHAKRMIVSKGKIDAKLLPYRQDVLDWLKKEHAMGRELILITASDVLIANQVAAHLSLFSKVLGSDGKTNLSAHKKSEVLTALYGEKKFSYAGNITADLTVWKKAHDAVVVGGDALATKAAHVTQISKHFKQAPFSLGTWLKAIRVHQWVKNILLFVPVITAHKLTNIITFQDAWIGFFSFSFMASAIYLGNDLLDLPADRQHVSKRFRPLAAGTIHPLQAVVAIVLLGAASFLLASYLPPLFMWLLGIYVITNLAYSWYFKPLLMIDVIVLAGLYVLRILAGGAATQIETSSWLFVFALFLFISLALLKRVIELHDMPEESEATVYGRGYKKSDQQVLTVLGISSGYISLLVLAFYITSSNVTYLYRTPVLLWLLIPLLLFWISRSWLLAKRGEIHSDPIMFALYDRASYITALIAITLLFLAS